MTTLTVSNLPELQRALASCEGGETILLRGGNYGDLALSGGSGARLAFASNVTLKSATPSNPAVFDSMSLQGARNMTFEDLKFDYNYQAGDAATLRHVTLQDVSNVTLRGCTLDGDVARGGTSEANGFGSGFGLNVRGSEGVVVEDCKVFDFFRGMVFSQVDGLTVRGNEVHSIRSDGMDFAEVQDVLIEGNYLHDFRKSPTSSDHCDMIQFWTNGTRSPSTNITIRDNILDIGDGTSTQSVFMRNELVDTGQASFARMAYQNVRIENNTITNAHAHGITVGETNGLVIASNSVLHADGGKDDGADPGVEIPRINVADGSRGVTITKNVTSLIVGEGSGWTVADNVLVQDQNAAKANHYSTVFQASSLTDDGAHHFLALAGSEVAGLGAGSTLTQGRTGAVSKPVDEAPAAPVASDDAPSAGPAKGVLSLLNGRFVTQEDGTSTDLGAASGWTSDGLQLGRAGITARVDRDHVDHVVGADAMTIAFTLDADARGSSGELFRLHGSFATSVTDDGELHVQVFQDNGSMATLTTSGSALNTLVERDHDVVINLQDSKLQIWVDGKMTGEVSVRGSIGGEGFGAHDLVFGNPWNKDNFRGDLSAFEINVDDRAAAASSKLLAVSSTQDHDIDHHGGLALADDDARFDLSTHHHATELAV
ncbi:right-handed parallel beta-helix repeat-containing protein [Rubellimicrobium arenae]|uniref:right-handed parallel beta-helix repeat-containing protein n=1 Tax=Rubellimicrobium arenae TaxID=2817372 RepID=UPI001B3003A0|nr:right-handed parallel beta-helix repeat-containing protein [Rubellimicrobium arenae]